MKIRILTLLFFIISNVVFGQHKNPDFFNVPTIHQTNGELHGEMDSIIIKVNQSSLHSDYNINYDKILWFNDLNQIIKKKYVDNHYRTITEFSSYDSNGVFKVVSISDEKEIKKTLFKLDKNKNLIEVKSLIDNKIFYTNKSNYKGEIKISTIIYDKDLNPNNILRFKYNEDGKLIEKTEEIPDLKYSNAGLKKTKYFYKKGLLNKELKYEKELISTTEFIYNKDSLLIKKVVSRVQNNYKNITEYKYKDKYLDEIIFKTNKNEVSELTKYQYQFDKNENLTNLTIKKDGIIIFDATYELIYK